jgi:hypothetical protein
LGQPQIMPTSVRVAPQVPTPEISDTDSAEPKFYEDGSVTFSDAPPSAPRQASHVTRSLQRSHLLKEIPPECSEMLQLGLRAPPKLRHMQEQCRKGGIVL